MVVKQVADKLTKALTGTTVDNLTKTEVVNTNKTVQDNESAGATGFLKAFGEIFTGPLKMIAIILIGLVVLGVIGIMVFKLMGSKSSAGFGTMVFGRKKFRFGRR
jgi:hypothetical protein